MPLPAGDAGTRRTVAEMRRLITEGARDPIVRQAVISVLRSSRVGDHNVDAQALAWFAYVRAILFVNDPDGTEWLQSARVTLQHGGGDCDDRAILMAAGLKSIGIPVRLVVVALDPNRGGTFSHVYVEAMLPARGWIAADPTYQSNTLGMEPPSASRVWRIPA